MQWGKWKELVVLVLAAVVLVTGLQIATQPGAAEHASAEVDLGRSIGVPFAGPKVDDAATWASESPTTSTWQLEAYSPFFVDVALLSTTEGWAADANGLLYRWDGARWAPVSDLGPLARVRAVQFLSPTEGWAAGGIYEYGGYYGDRIARGMIWRFDGTAWHEETGNFAGVVNDLAVLSKTNIWAVGMQEDKATVTPGAIWHYSGGNWQSVPAPATFELHAIQMLSATDGWIVGQAAQRFPLTGIILRYDGVSWQPVFEATTILHGLDMLSPTDGWAVGMQGNVVHYNGSKWIEDKGIFTDGSAIVLDGVTMLTADEGWIVGYDTGQNEWTSADDRAIALRFDEQGWAQVSLPNIGGLHAVAQLPSGDGWAVGVDALVRLAGSTWQNAHTYLQPTGVTPNVLIDVTLLSPRLC